jgi:hypothetical protein
MMNAAEVGKGVQGDRGPQETVKSTVSCAILKIEQAVLL